MVPKDDPTWLQYEQSVREMLAAFDPGAQVLHNQKVIGHLSAVGRQVDVWASGSVVGLEIRVAVECKRHARPLDVGKVDEFAGKLIDLNADRGLLYSYSGFTEGAVRRAVLAGSPRIMPIELEMTADVEYPGPVFSNQSSGDELTYEARLVEDLSTLDFTHFLTDSA